jgi:hypothetical protein
LHLSTPRDDIDVADVWQDVHAKKAMTTAENAYFIVALFVEGASAERTTSRHCLNGSSTLQAYI